MKVVGLKPVIKNNKLVLEEEIPMQDKSIDQLDNITADLVKLNFQRYLVRKSRQIDKSILQKEFK